MDTDQIKELIERSRKGDSLAQHRLFHQYIRAMYNTALRLMGSEFEAEDVVQEGFIKAFQRLSQFEQRANFGAWLKRIIINTALDRLRMSMPEFTGLESIDPVHEDEQEEISLPSPEQVNEEILRLPEGCRQVFSLYLLEGYSQQEVADELGISVSTVKTQYRRARLLLRERLK